MEVTKANGHRAKLKKADPLNRLIDLTAERATLAAMIQQPAEIPGIAGEVSSADFHDQSLGLLFQHVTELASSKQLIGRDSDLALIVSRCRAAGDLEQIGGSAAICKLLEVPPHHGQEHAATVRRLAATRQLLRTAEELPGAIIAGCVDEVVQLLDSASASAQAATAGRRAREIQSAVKLAEQHPKMRPEVIEGLLRQGETLNLIGASKAGKSWLIHGLAVAVANGLPWLGMNVTQGRVLLIDNELHPETLVDRLQNVVSKTNDPNGLNSVTLHGIDVLSLRGVTENADVTGLAQRLATVQPGDYRLIVLDALYRALPAGTSESDNAQMMMVYNQLDRIARTTGAAIVCNHHSSKGDQSGKAVVDVGSGAGSISRATDSHLVIRPHEDSELCVLEAVCRSFKPVQPKSIRFEWPLWLQSMAEPKLKQPKNGQQRQQETQQAKDADAKNLVLSIIGDKGVTEYQLRNETGFGPPRLKRLIAQLKRDGDIKIVQKVNRKTKARKTLHFRS